MRNIVMYIVYVIWSLLSLISTIIIEGKKMEALDYVTLSQHSLTYDTNSLVFLP